MIPTFFFRWTTAYRRYAASGLVYMLLQQVEVTRGSWGEVRERKKG